MRHVVRRILAWIVPPLLLLAVVLGAPIVLEFWGWQGTDGTGGNVTEPDAVVAPGEDADFTGSDNVIVLTPAGEGDAAGAEPPRSAPADAGPPTAPAAPAAPAPAWSVATLGNHVDESHTDAVVEKEKPEKGEKHGKPEKGEKHGKPEKGEKHGNGEKHGKGEKRGHEGKGGKGRH